MQEKIKPIAFYLPQFHEVKENSEWWGPGFTEWTNVSKARPHFKNHHQPQIPRELGFYDLSNIEVIKKQTMLAKEHGIYGFCFYYYRFKNGRRILEKPLEQYIQSDIDFPFCYCWANENWTRRWDGSDKEILLQQEHGGPDDLDFIKELIPIFKDKRYIKIQGKPLLIIYQINLIKKINEISCEWKNIVKQAGFPDLHLCAIDHYNTKNADSYNADAMIEFPPHKFVFPNNQPNLRPKIKNQDFKGSLVDYRKIIKQSLNKKSKKEIYYRGIIPGWDNTARRKNNPTICINSSPKLYKFWLSYLADYTKNNLPKENQFIFINAWNEWAEGAHLEPDLKYGLDYLNATLEVVNEKKIDLKDYIKNENIFKFILNNLEEDELKLIRDAFIFGHHTQYITNEQEALKYYHGLNSKDKLRVQFPKIYKILKIFKNLKNKINKLDNEEMSTQC